MRLLIKYITVILSIVLLFSCSSSRKAKSTGLSAGSLPGYAEDYIMKYSDLAVREMHRTGIPASITLAQGMLESDYGRSTLAKKSNNHFGIKCHNDWNGKKVYHDDNRKGECFRAYQSVEDSYVDHSDFLVNGSRYKDLFRLSNTDYKGWAHGLKKAGYATDPNYPSLLIRKIDEYRLHEFDTGRGRTAKADDIKLTEINSTTAKKTDQMVTQPAVNISVPVDSIAMPVEEKAPVRVISLGKGRTGMNNNVQFVVVREGDTYRSLAEEYQLLSWEITRYNDLPANSTLQPGQILYLQPKRSKAESGLTIHIVQPGETIYSISQKYAVKLSSLYKMNLMNEGTECVEGQKLRLR